MKIITLEQIREVLPSIDLVPQIEAGFAAYSRGRAVVPPVGELVMTEPPGDVHIKYGYLEGDEYYVIKIASGFYDNPKLGLPSSNGLMLLFRQATGEPLAALLDEGYLTDVRTAVAGAITAKYLAPAEVSRVGIVGTGVQARMQLEFLEGVVACTDVTVWGRDPEKLDAYKADMELFGLKVTTTLDVGELIESCNLIVTTTPASEPILKWTGGVTEGLHITAMGSDTPHKQEVDAAFLGRADVVVADSVSQCLTRGEIHHALEDGAIREDEIVELGDIVAGNAVGRESEAQFTIADLTGVAVQDIQITKAVYESLV